jgi:flagellin
MVINTNVEAQRTASNLMVSQQRLAKSLARLSSGTKIVTASDDAAGLAVSSRLDSQLRRLDAVLDNLGNAMSLTQTQDGYLGNIDNALTRMTELAMMAQDNTKQEDDRKLYNEEFQQLLSYVRSTRDKDFNGIPLFNGEYVDITIDAQGGTFPVGGVDLGSSVYSSALKEQTWKLTNEAWETSKSGYVLNQAAWKLTGTAYKLDQDLWFNNTTNDWVTADPSDAAFTKYDAGTFVRVEASTAVDTVPPPANVTQFNAGDLTTSELSDPNVGNGLFTATTHFTAYASGSFIAGEPVGNGDLENQHRKAVGKGYFVFVDPSATGTSDDVDAANHPGSSTVVTQQDISANAADLGGVKITTLAAAKDALTKIMSALDQLHLDRASLGAIQSRIDFTSQQLTTSKQNMSQARSRITDVDIAAETTEFARQQILVQAGTQMLREANNLPRTALELLR